MAGGVKKPVNIFKLKATGLPPEVFNWRLWFALLTFGLLGSARGVDEGLISGAFKSKNFQQSINFASYSAEQQANIKGNVTAMVLIGSVGGSLIAFLICDRIGRLWAMRQLCLVWILGISIFLGSNGSLPAIYAGRFIAGLGIGQTVVVGPVYLAEISPAPIRGLCTCSFTGFAYTGVVAAYFTNYGASLHLEETKARWQVPISLHIMYATVIFICSFFVIESPRFLISKGKREQAVANMSRIRNLPRDHPLIVEEIGAIERSWFEEKESTTGQGFLGVMREIFLIPSNLYRLYIGVAGQLLAQWSGAGSITLYAVDFFSLIGITGDNESLLVTGVFGIIKFLAAMICALFLVDVIGRKRSLLIGITLQSISMIYVASFLTSVPQLGVAKNFVLPDSKKAASFAAVVMIYVSGFGWALGWNSMQYLLSAELFPLRIRSASTSIIMFVHFVNQYGNARAVPNMLLPKSLGGIEPKGTFWCFAVVTVLGGLWVLVTIPETAGRSLESMDRLFELPWYKIGLFGNKDAEARDAAAENVEKGHVEYIEEAPRKV